MNEFSQISRIAAESQQIVAQRPLSCVQYRSSLFKSSTKDLSLPIFELVFSLVCASFVCERTVPQPLLWSWAPPQGRSLYVLMITSGKADISPLSSMDSGLEAFSRNPTHGSFSALTFQSTELTNYVNQRFLSYWIGLLLRRPLHQ